MPDEIKVQAKGLNKKFLFIAIILIVVGLVAALVLLLPTSAKAKKVEAQLSLGAKYLSELDYEQAIVAYEAVIKIDPKCEEAYLALADIYVATGAFDMAEEILKRVEEELGGGVELLEEKKQEVAEERKQAENTLSPVPSPTAILTPEPAATPTNTPISSPTNTPSVTPTNSPSPTPTELSAAHTIYEGTTVELSEAEVGDVVLFGTYEQDNIASNGAEAIPWYVLDKDGDKLLLMSVYLLDAVPYHEEWETITWEDCTLRQWMNDDFYNRAFTQSEKKHILTSYLKNEDNPKYGTEGGNDTEDKVFALSLAEAEQYFGIAEDEDYYWVSATPEFSAAKVTAYAEAQGVWVSKAESPTGNGWWWLRSPGHNSNHAAYVSLGGLVDVVGITVGYDGAAARPVLWLNLNP